MGLKGVETVGVGATGRCDMMSDPLGFTTSSIGNLSGL